MYHNSSLKVNQRAFYCLGFRPPLDSAASRTAVLQCGTVCPQPCAKTCHWLHLRQNWKPTFSDVHNDCWRPPGAVAAVSRFRRRDISDFTLLLTYLDSNFIEANAYMHLPSANGHFSDILRTSKLGQQQPLHLFKNSNAIVDCGYLINATLEYVGPIDRFLPYFFRTSQESMPPHHSSLVMLRLVHITRSELELLGSVYLPLYSFFTQNGKHKNAIWISIFHFYRKWTRVKWT